MGKKHQETRKKTKAVLRQFGVYETELGELKVKTTKAEARRQLARKMQWGAQRVQCLARFENALIQCMSGTISRDIDQEVFCEMERAGLR